MNKLFLVALLSFLSAVTCAVELDAKDAIKLAESFIAKNGYTNLPISQVDKQLNNESLELYGSRENKLKARFNTLQPKAIGVRHGRRGTDQGWSVAFDYVNSSNNDEGCRVVTMNVDGSDIRVEHVTGARKHFLGFDPDNKQ